MGAFLKNKRALLYSLQNLGGARAPSAPGSYVYDQQSKSLKGVFHPAYLARAVSWFAFVVVIFMGHENCENKGQPRDDTWFITMNIFRHGKRPWTYPTQMQTLFSYFLQGEPTCIQKFPLLPGTSILPINIKGTKSSQSIFITTEFASCFTEVPFSCKKL